MNNRDKYKKSFSAFYPTDEAVEKVYEMTIDSKKRKSNPWVRRVCACIMAFALIISGGLGVNYIVQKSGSDNELGVIVAYANGDSFKIGSRNEQKLFYGIYVMPYDNEVLSNQVYQRWCADVTESMAESERFGKSGSTASGGQGSGGVQNPETEEMTATVNTLRAGDIALSLDDYSNVKTFTVENASSYGWLDFDYLDGSERLYSEEVDASSMSEEERRQFFLQDHKFIITGDALRRSQNSGYYEGGTKHIVNKGYFLNWVMSDELKYEIGKDPYFDLSHITDIITFTVEFDDGTVKTASLNLYFDSDGYMHFE